MYFILVNLKYTMKQGFFLDLSTLIIQLARQSRKGKQKIQIQILIKSLLKRLLKQDKVN